jgi:hypothetical protein
MIFKIFFEQIVDYVGFVNLFFKYTINNFITNKV